MDYLDTGKQDRHNFMLFTGYILVAIAITIATILLVQRAYGFGLGKKGTVIQNGLAFFSSQPNPAQIRVNGQLYSSTTNTRLYLPENVYNISLSRAGYYDWQRTIEIEGGKVEHFDYPFLFPKTLTTNKVQAYASAPGLITQSPDRRWLLVTKPGSLAGFDVYDLKNQTSPKVGANFNLPEGLLTKATGSESLQLAEWADDNQHVLLQHNFDGKTEFILVDRANPALSRNLNTDLSINPSKITLRNKKFDQYYMYDSSSGTLLTASLKSGDKTTILQHVLAYQSYGDNTVLYVTDSDAPVGKVWLRLLTGDKPTTLRSFPASTSYVVDLTQYNGTMFVSAGAAALGKVYIYKDPVAQLANQPGQAIVPAQVLRLNQPNYLSFSDNAQFIVAEGGSSFGIYDIQNDQGYSYTLPTPLDAPMAHAEWMDGDRLDYVSNGKLIIFDYDQSNRHELVPASSRFLPAFSPDYKFVYTMSISPNGQYVLQQTWLLASADR